MKKINLLITVIFLTIFTISCSPNLNTDISKYSYSIGYRIAQSMKSQNLKLEMDKFKSGFNNGMTNKKVKIDPKEQSKSYLIGTQISSNFKSDNLEVDNKAFFFGIETIMDEKDSALPEKEIKSILETLTKKITTKRKEIADKNLKIGNEFLTNNKTKKGIISTKTGLQYKIIKAGKGKKVKTSDKVKVHYQGTLLDGTEFDSSYKRKQPIVFPVTGVIKGWIEGLQLMKKGAIYQFFIPGSLAYGKAGTQNIPGNSVLVFKVELIDIIK